MFKFAGVGNLTYRRFTLCGKRKLPSGTLFQFAEVGGITIRRYKQGGTDFKFAEVESINIHNLKRCGRRKLVSGTMLKIAEVGSILKFWGTRIEGKIKGNRRVTSSSCRLFDRF